jgi:hypothetical protein
MKLSSDWKVPYQPADATNEQLADDWRLFIAAIANLDAGKDEPFSYDDIYTWSIACLKEILNRMKKGEMKFSIAEKKSPAYEKLWREVSKALKPDELAALSDSSSSLAIYLVSPHAELIAAKEKTMIIKSRDFSNECEKELVFCGPGLCFGTLKLKNPFCTSRAGLDELYPLHHVTPEEIQEWWPDVNEFYCYDIYDLAIWAQPRRAEIPQGVQTFIENVKLLDSQQLAPVNPSGNELGDEITLEEIIPYFKSFYRTKPYASLVGGLCTQGKTAGDIDIFINSTVRDLVTEFRIIRMFPQKYWFRFQFHYPSENHPGKFTSYIDLFHEFMEVVKQPELVLMSAPKKVELFKFAPLLKPAHGHYKGEEYSVDKLIEIVNSRPNWYESKIAVQRKFDGIHCRIDHAKDGKVVIFSEEGTEITDKCPTICSEIKEICKDRDVVFTGELESWEKGKHNPRQMTTAIVHSKGVHPKESSLKLNLFDCLYYN